MNAHVHPMLRDIINAHAPAATQPATYPVEQEPGCSSCDRLDRCARCPAPPRSFPDFRDGYRCPRTDGDLDTRGRAMKAGT